MQGPQHQGPEFQQHVGQHPFLEPFHNILCYEIRIDWTHEILQTPEWTQDTTKQYNTQSGQIISIISYTWMH